MKSINYNGKELYWKRIQLISFVLAVFIVIRHNSSPANYDSLLVRKIYDCIKCSVTEVAVPLFFLISGFNFFRDYSHSSYKRKLKSRVKSLLVPYLSWNTIYCAFCMITSIDFFARFFIGRERFVISPLNILLGCTFHEYCNSHFWFVFDLMICVALNPLLFYIIRKRYIGLSFLTILYIVIFVFGFSLPVFVFYRTDAFLYYYLGAFLGLHYNSYFIEEIRLSKATGKTAGSNKLLNSQIFYFLFGFICVGSTVLLLIPKLYNGLRFPIVILGSFGIWLLSASCTFLKFNHLPQGGTTFFIYAAHGIIQPIVVKLLYLILPKYRWMGMINVFLAVFLTVALCIFLRLFTKRFVSPLDKILTGWRR